MSNGLDFERQVHALLKNMGFEAEITKASGDGGIDIIAHSKEHITGGKYIIQCKDWSKPVGEPPVRDLYGVVTAENANKGILITTSTFTSPAINFAAGKPLELIDGTKFNQLLAKYNSGGMQETALSTADDERIKILTEQVNKNPKNILAIKELADIYLLQGNYNKAAELYERIIPLKPTVETERLTNAYTGGLNNYGVALAKLKRYDEAIKMFQQAFYKGCLQEASLTHYLGLYDIATELYQKVKSIANRPEIFDEFIERAYLQMPPVYPHLSPVLSQDETNDAILIPLETAQQKASEEGKINVYAPLFNATDVLKNEWMEFRSGYANNIANGIYLEKTDEMRNDFLKLGGLMDACRRIIDENKNIVEVPSQNEFHELFRQIAIKEIEQVNQILSSLEEQKDIFLMDHGTWEEHVDIVLKNIWQDLPFSDMTSLWERVVEVRNNIEAKWEDVINKEKAEWRAKIRGSIYQQTANNMTADELKGHLAQMKENLKSKWQTNN